VITKESIDMNQIEILASEVNQEYQNICKEIELKKIAIDDIELKIAESKKYLSILKKDKENSNSILSPYSKEDIIDEHITTELESQKEYEKELNEEKKVLLELSKREEKTKKLSETIDELTNDNIILIKKEELQHLISYCAEGRKELLDKAIEMKNKIEAYVYFDPERTKQEIDVYIDYLRKNEYNSIIEKNAKNLLT